jgi:LysR family hydrogen peroxide-inducible transcriptional activator
MVAINMGVTLMPALAVASNPLVKYIPFADPRPARDLIFAFRKTHVRRELFQAMADLIQSIVNDY